MWIVTLPSGEKRALIAKNMEASGGFGLYFPLGNKLGLKIILSYLSSKNTTDGKESVSKLKKSPLWRAAKKEFETLVLTNEHLPGLTPKAEALITVFSTDTQLWYPAILMEHIHGFLLEELMECVEIDKTIQGIDAYFKNGFVMRGETSNPPKDATPVEEFLTTEFKKLGFIHKDLHWGNILVSPSFKIKVIDFGNIKKVKK